MPDLIDLRIGFLCARCNEYRTRCVFVSPQLSADNTFYFINGDAYRVCLECEGATKNDAQTINRNADARRAASHPPPIEPDERVRAYTNACIQADSERY